jgi:hypothetical protein
MQMQKQSSIACALKPAINRGERDVVTICRCLSHNQPVFVLCNRLHNERSFAFDLKSHPGVHLWRHIAAEKLPGEEPSVVSHFYQLPPRPKGVIIAVTLPTDLEL